MTSVSCYVVQMDHGELGWCAGFIDGEGHFGLNNRTPLLTVSQTVEEPLLHLRAVLGVGLNHGPFTKGTGKRGPHKPVWTWQVNGFERVQFVTAVTWPWLHVKRGQAVNVLLAARLDPAHRTLRKEGWNPKNATHCASGHEFTPNTTYISSDGHRSCRTCGARRAKAIHDQPCIQAGCNRGVMTTGLCRIHYEEIQAARGIICIVSDCDRGQVAKSLCFKHYKRLWQYGLDGPSKPPAALRTHCPQDHEYTPENTYINPRGSRTCRTCTSKARQRWQAKRRLDESD